MSHRMFSEAFESGNCPIKVPLGRPLTSDNLGYSSLILEIKHTREEREYDEENERIFFVMFPDGADRKKNGSGNSEHEADEGTARVSQKYESEENEYPESDEEMVFFFGTEIVHEESDVDEDKIRSRIRPVEYPLKSTHIGPIYPMVDRRRSTETPVGEIRRKSKMEEECFFEYKTDQYPENERPRRGDEEESNVFGHRSRQELAPMFGDEECDQELEIIPTTIDEVPERKSIEERNKDENENISDNQRVQDIHLRPFFFLEVFIYNNPPKCNEEDFLEIRNSRYPELRSEEHAHKDAPWEKDNKQTENTVKHRNLLGNF